MGFKVAVAGATGAVGQEMLRVLERRDFPIDELVPLASSRSAGKELTYKGHGVTVRELGEDSFAGLDLALFSAGASRSKQFARACVDAGCLMVDNSSAFRMDPAVPLVVPEVNPDHIHKHQGIIANPNCTTIIMLTALAPLHRVSPIRRIVVATYQAASGAGQAAMDELEEATRMRLAGEPFAPRIFPFDYAFNFFPHNSDLLDNGYCQEEMKMVHETHKMLDTEQIGIHATCVRVPVLRTHGEAINAEFADELTVERAYEILSPAPGVKIFEDRPGNRWAMPDDVSGQDDVYVGRIRRDPSQANTLDLWVVGDQLLKGAALNAVQIAEMALGLR